MKGIIQIVKNTEAGTFHPILYLESPLPGSPDLSITRYKSKMHHTTGFKTREEAVDSINNDFVPNVKKNITESLSIELENDVEWDGEDVPLANFVR